MSPRIGRFPLREAAARALASAFLGGAWHLRSLLARGAHALDAGGPWLRTLAVDVMTRFPVAPSHDALLDFVRLHEALLQAWRLGEIPHRTPRPALDVPQMGERRWPVPALGTTSELAAWLGLLPRELDWFADQRGMLRKAPPVLQHYCFTWVSRGAKVGRLLEAPKPRLKALQRKILDEVLAHVPAHDAAHGFVRGRSVSTHAALHVGKPMVMRFDLRAFFTSITAPRAYGVFAALGYPRHVVRAFVGLCTTRTPRAVLSRAPYPVPFATAAGSARFMHLQSLDVRHLPQGAPTSPALANLAAHGLDVRLSALAEKLGLRYSRYADDLVFSGEVRSAGALSEQVRAIARDEGFSLNDDKTRAMPAHTRQAVTGVVVNARPNLAREEYDLLKARLHRCLVNGPGADAARLRAELQGRIAWAAQLNPARAAKLQKTFERIEWSR
jgi:hypothetical protein